MRMVTTNLQPVDTRQHQIEDNGIPNVFLQLFKRSRAVRFMNYLVTLILFRLSCKSEAISLSSSTKMPFRACHQCHPPLVVLKAYLRQGA